MANFTETGTDFGAFALATLDTAQSDRAKSSFVIDLRRSPRVKTRFPATLITDYGKVSGLVTDLSRGGLRFEGSKLLADLLLAELGRSSDDAPVMVEAGFSVPGDDGVSMPVVVQARTVYIICNDEDVYLCGLEFKSFAEGEPALESYLQERTRTRGQAG